jgi:hypothetical protein
MHIHPCEPGNECRNMNQTTHVIAYVEHKRGFWRTEVTCRKWQASESAHIASAHVELQILCNGSLSVQLRLHWSFLLHFPKLSDGRRSSRRRSRTLRWRRREQIVEEALGPLDFLMDNKYSVSKYEETGNDQYVFSTIINKCDEETMIIY